MEKIDVAGLKINFQKKAELLRILQNRLSSGQKTWITTPYSEFLYRALGDEKILETLNKADLAVPDGIGIFWAKRFLDLPLSAKNYWLKIFQAFWQAAYSLAAIILRPRWITSGLGDKIPGSGLIWDLAEMASRGGKSVYLLGGFGQTAKTAAEKLKLKNAGLKIAGWSNKNPGDPSAVEDIKNASPDILLVAYGPIKQERWICENLNQLPVKLAVGLGGTFDYIAGKKAAPREWVRAAGLEWLFRLLTQPRRVKRICQATFGLAWRIVHYKIFRTFPMRANAVCVITNVKGEIFIGRKLGTGVDIIKNRSPEKWKNYWQLPQGGVEEGENEIETGKREAEEETGMAGLAYIYTSQKKFSYVWNNSLRGFWHNRDYKFRGQNQKILYFKFNGDSAKIRLPEGEEFCEYKWVSPNDLTKSVAGERREVAELVHGDFAEGLIKWQ